MRASTRIALVSSLILTVSAVLPGTARAQPYHSHHGSVVLAFSFGYPYYPFYSPWFYGGGWYPYYWGTPYWAAYGPQWYEPPDRSAKLRLEVTPKNTEVYVDGYYSGIVDDFDGTFQRLHVQPGQHEIVLYLKGYRTIKQTINLGPGADYKVRQKMVKLAPGETSEPPPAPPKTEEGARTRQAPPGENAPPPVPPYEPRRPERRPPPGREPGEAAAFGMLAIRVQPADAEVFVDGERWQGPEGQGPLVVHLAEGMHHVEVRKDGYVPFSTDVRVRAGETSPLNVSLPERR